MDSPNDRDAAQKIYDGITAFTVFTRDKNITDKVFKAILSGVTQREDYLTAENVIADPATGDRISSLLSLKTVIDFCEIKHPTVDQDGTVLSDLQYAMAVPTSDIIVSPQGAAADSAMRSQLRFGFDAVTEILKNCCASHTVIHSILKGALMTLHEKVREWGPQQLETPGQEMALCTILQLVGNISDIVRSAKDATAKKPGDPKSSSSCGRCKEKGHGSSTIITPFTTLVNAKYAERTSSVRRAVGQRNNPPPEFLVKGGRKPPRITRPSLSSMTEDWATGRVKERAKKARLDNSVKLLMDHFAKERDISSDDPRAAWPNTTWTEASPNAGEGVASATLPDLENVPPLAPSPSVATIGEELRSKPLISPLPATPHPHVSDALAPTAEQVKNIRGPEEWIRLRDSANNKAIANFAVSGSGINTGKYRKFNPTLYNDQ